MLPGAQVVRRLRLPSAFVAGVVLPVVQHVMLLDALDLLELPLDERCLVFVALALFAGDSFEILAVLSEC